MSPQKQCPARGHRRDEHESKSASICSSSTSGRTTSKHPSTSKAPKERTRPLVYILQQEGLVETEHERAVQENIWKEHLLHAAEDKKCTPCESISCQAGQSLVRARTCP